MAEILEEQTFLIQWVPSPTSYQSEIKNIAAVPWQIGLQNLAPVLSATVYCNQNRSNQWTCKAEVMITLKHPYNRELDIIKTFEQIFSPERYTYNIAFGDMQDVKADFIVDNKINVEVTIRVKKFRNITLAKLEEEIESLALELSSLKKEFEFFKREIFAGRIHSGQGGQEETNKAPWLDDLKPAGRSKAEANGTTLHHVQ